VSWVFWVGASLIYLAIGGFIGGCFSKLAKTKNEKELAYMAGFLWLPVLITVIVFLPYRLFVDFGQRFMEKE